MALRLLQLDADLAAERAHVAGPGLDVNRQKRAGRLDADRHRRRAAGTAIDRRRVSFGLNTVSMRSPPTSRRTVPAIRPDVQREHDVRSPGRQDEHRPASRPAGPEDSAFRVGVVVGVDEIRVRTVFDRFDRHGRQDQPVRLGNDGQRHDLRGSCRPGGLRADSSSEARTAIGRSNVSVAGFRSGRPTGGLAATLPRPRDNSRSPSRWRPPPSNHTRAA